MSRKFKLVKIYPGSPEIGTEVVYFKEDTVYKTDNKDCGIELPKDQVENFPEYWKEVVYQPKYIFHSATNSITRLWDHAYFSKGMFIKTPVSDSACLIYNIYEQDGKVICDNTHSFLLKNAGLDWLEVAEPCTFSKKDLLDFANNYYKDNIKAVTNPEYKTYGDAGEYFKHCWKVDNNSSDIRI